MRTRKSVQLQTVLAVYEQETHQDRSSLNYQKLKTMVRTRNFKVTNERIETVLVNSERGKLSALEGHQDAINGKQEDSVQKEMLAVSATTMVSVERKRNRPLLRQGRRNQMTEKDLRKEMLPEAVVLQDRNIKKRADFTLKETARIRRVIIGILPYVKITKLNRDANSAISAYSGTLRLTVSPAKSRRKVVENDLLPR